MAFVNMHIIYFFSDFLHFDTSLLLLTVALRGVSNKHCLLSLFSLDLFQSLYDFFAEIQNYSIFSDFVCQFIQGH